MARKKSQDDLKELGLASGVLKKPKKIGKLNEETTNAPGGRHTRRTGAQAHWTNDSNGANQKSPANLTS